MAIHQFNITEDWQRRVGDEFYQLGLKIDKLDSFTKSEAFLKVEQHERSLLVQQLSAMRTYHDLLYLRMAGW